MHKNIDSYMTEVLEILESFDYPSFVVFYEPADVSRSIAGTVVVNYTMGISPMMTAIIIWSLTLNYQILSDNQVKH